MELEKPLTAAAAWLNSTFGSMDQAILNFYHSVHDKLGTPMDVFMQLFTKLGDGGIFLIILALCLMLFKKTRKVGIGMLGGIIIGALFTNVCIKNIVARPRPYVFWNECSEWVKDIWHWKPESEFSFPSGHTTAAMASMTPIFFFCNKKKSWTVFLFVIAIGATRNYIMVHYPSDILGGIIVGGIAGFLSFLIVNAVYDKLCEKGKFGQTLKDGDIRNVLHRKEKSV